MVAAHSVMQTSCISRNLERPKPSALATQPGPDAAGKLVDYEAGDISPDMSFLEMLDVVNERLIEARHDPIGSKANAAESLRADDRRQDRISPRSGSMLGCEGAAV